MLEINEQLLNWITIKACESPRLRMNHNLHASSDDKVQRLLNAMEPGTVLPVHRHKNTDETYVLLRGKLDVKVYNEQKELIATHRLDPNEGKYGMHIPANSWHTIEVLEKGTVIFEVKEGPYLPLKEDDMMDV
ncbi:MAG: WbuC family cupin fold metalloprotein [Paludibacter sp.]|nr:WbuC family cupin fold metalloprotein [Paludibacter sp.]